MAGDSAFDEWYRQAHARLLNAIALAAGDLEVAREVTDEAFARCLERWDGGRRPHDPTAWTYRVAVNLLRRRWRRRRREHDLAILAIGPGSVELPEPAVELWRAVGALPDRARLAVVLRYVGGLGEREVAEAMGIAPGTVAATLSKARDRLRAELGEPPTPTSLGRGHATSAVTTEVSDGRR
ncbi:MAG: sigma-70 family polymerase sigma factor [Acidimicrobiales bacterium]|nr:sigma-70 family polymerase sigma factor [Acidimicrobiales bacterium]